MQRKITGFRWQDHIVEKVMAKHSVEPSEAEEALLNDDPAPFIVRREERYLAYCQSESSGRYLFIVYALEQDGTARMISAREMTDREKAMYKNRKS